MESKQFQGYCRDKGQDVAALPQRLKPALKEEQLSQRWSAALHVRIFALSVGNRTVCAFTV